MYNQNSREEEGGKIVGYLNEKNGGIYCKYDRKFYISKKLKEVPVG